MSLAEDLDEFFADSDEVIVQEPLKFKAQLGIGEKAYGLLRAREKMGTFSQAIGIGAGASTIAGSSVVASTFFASSGFMASALSTIGLGATAVTPVGWVIAAGVLSGGAYVGVTRLLERSKDNGLIIVPKYINTPLDVIAVALIELMLPVSLKIANAGGGIQQSELTAIRNFFSDEWGYSPGFVDRLIEEYQDQIDAVSYSNLAESLGNYCAESKDCDREAIMAGFLAHLRTVVEADGIVDDEEKAQLDQLTKLLIMESEKTGGNRTITAALVAASRGLNESKQAAAQMASAARKAAAEGVSKGTSYIIESGRVTAEKSTKLFDEFSDSEAAKALKDHSTKVARKSSEIASVGLEAGTKYASEAGKLTTKKAKDLWKSFSGLRGKNSDESNQH